MGSEKISIIQKNEELVPDNPSTRIMVSYGFGKFVSEFFTLAFTAYVFFFYEVEIGLSTQLTAIGYIIYAAWNAINDPLVGYLTNKSSWFVKRWGHRFGWIVVSAIPWVFIYILIFTPPRVSPTEHPYVLFTWLTLWACVFDTLYSIWDVNYQSLFPDKFRSAETRRKAAGIATIVGVFGIALGAIVPPMLVEDGNLTSYMNQGVIVAFIGFVAVIAMLPGVKETESMKKRDIALMEARKNAPDKEEDGFFKIFVRVLKNHNFLAFILLYFLYQSLTQSMTGSIPYYTKYILERPQEDVTFIMAAFLAGALVSIPFWMKVAHNVNDNKKMIIIGAVLLIVLSSPFIWLKDYTLSIVVMGFWGIGLGLFWAMTGPVMADAIDEIVVNEKARNEGIYMGFRAFFGRLAYVVQALNFWIVHELTGFQEGSDVQTSLAIEGIHIHMALVPILLLILGTFVFAKMYTLTPNRLEELRNQIKQMGL